MPAKIEPIGEVQLASRLGFLSKALWREFFGRGTERWQNACWEKLWKSGVFVKHRIVPDVLLLNQRNLFVRGQAGSFARAPHANQLFHDEIVGQTYLRLTQRYLDWIVQIEADLKKAEPLRNKGKRIAQQTKHPDLLMSSPKGQRIAIEIELTPKSLARYMQALRSYRSKGLHGILFVVRSSATRAAIRRAIAEIRFPSDEISIGFCPLGEWRIDPNTVNVEIRQQFKTLNDLLGIGASTSRVVTTLPQPGNNPALNTI